MNWPHTHIHTPIYVCVRETHMRRKKTNNTNEQTNERVEKHLICSQNWTAPATAPTPHISNETVNSWIVSFVINAVIWNVVINFNDELCVQVCDCVCVNIARTRSACFKLFRIEWITEWIRWAFYFDGELFIMAKRHFVRHFAHRESHPRESKGGKKVKTLLFLMADEALYIANN